jgi:DNA-binding transcriptional MerR regulator
MSGIRTNAAAELLGVSPNTLRSWERRFGYPAPRRTAGGHRQYELTELEALRRALLETHNISSAIQVARQRGEGLGSASRMVEAFDRFDEPLADRLLEESLSLRSIERTVEELLLPGLELALNRDGREAEFELACRWATGWLHAARRVTAPASRSEGILIFDSSPTLGMEGIQVQALELALRRAGPGADDARDARARPLGAGTGRQRGDARRARPARLRRAPDRLLRPAVRVPRFDAGERQPQHPHVGRRAQRGCSQPQGDGRRSRMGPRQQRAGRYAQRRPLLGGQI